MMGEATSKSRPKDSLLEVHLDFDAADKLAPAQCYFFVFRIILKIAAAAASVKIKLFGTPQPNPFSSLFQ